MGCFQESIRYLLATIDPFRLQNGVLACVTKTGSAWNVLVVYVLLMIFDKILQLAKGELL